MQIVIDISEEQMDMVKNSYRAIFADVYTMMANIIKNGTPLDDVLNKIKEEIEDNTYFINEITEKEGVDFETVEKIIDKYRTESEGRE